jgi:3D (Asp-Asp-Asp) domain-containing protein
MAAGAAAVGFAAAHLHHATLAIQTPSGIEDRRFWTWAGDWRAALAASSVRINPHDRLNLALSAPVTTPLVIRRAIRVNIHTMRRCLTVWTTAYRVRNILAAAHVRVGPLDEVRPGLGVRLSGLHPDIEVIRRWYVTEETTAPVPFNTVYRPDPAMFVGNSRIVQSGRTGLARTVVRVLMQNGRPVRREPARTTVVTPPLDEVIAYGTTDTVARGGQVIQFVREIDMVATAYWPNPAWSDGFTATGQRAGYGLVAVDPRVIPLGTRLYIPGYGFAVAADTGSAIVGDRIDLGYSTAWQADAWGVRNVQVFVLR